MKRQTLFLLLKAGLAIAAISYLVYFIDLATLWETAKAAQPVWIGAALLLLPLNLLLDGFIWYLFVRVEVPEVTLRRAYGALFCGFALGFFTPGRVGEFAGRAFYLEHGNKWTISAIILAERLLGMIVVMAVGAGALYFFILMTAPPVATAWWGMMVFGLGAAVSLSAVLLFPRAGFRVLSRLIRSERVLDKIRFLSQLSAKRMLGYLSLSALRYGIYTSQFYLLLRAFAQEASIVAGYAGVALTFFVKFITPPVTLMDIGIREGAAVYFISQFGIPEAAAFNAALLIFFVNIMIPASIGLPFIFKMRFRKTKQAVEETMEEPVRQPVKR